MSSRPTRTVRPRQTTQPAPGSGDACTGARQRWQRRCPAAREVGRAQARRLAPPACTASLHSTARLANRPSILPSGTEDALLLQLRELGVSVPNRRRHSCCGAGTSERQRREGRRARPGGRERQHAPSSSGTPTLGHANASAAAGRCVGARFRRAPGVAAGRRASSVAAPTRGSACARPWRHPRRARTALAPAGAWRGERRAIVSGDTYGCSSTQSREAVR